jgi:hypothetical protein
MIPEKNGTSALLWKQTVIPAVIADKKDRRLPTASSI